MNGLLVEWHDNGQKAHEINTENGIQYCKSENKTEQNRELYFGLLTGAFFFGSSAKCTDSLITVPLSLYSVQVPSF